jgi:predicted nucleic acid-binding protein
MLQVESRDYLRFRISFGQGESAAIAIAMHRGGTLVIDDGAARGAAESVSVTCLSTVEFLARLDKGELGLL